MLLVHGIAGNAAQWDAVIPLLAERYTVIAPDLLGHGQSAKPADRLLARRLRRRTA